MTLGMRNSKAEHVDFGFLSGIVPGKNILPSNIDMVLCKDGVKFLFAEWKKDGEELLAGQKIILKGLAKVHNFTSLVIIGYSNENGVHVDKFYKVTQDKLIYIDSGAKALKSYLEEWWKVN